MTERKNIILLAGIVLAVSLLSSSLTAVSLTKYYDQAYTQALGWVCQSVIETLGSGQQNGIVGADAFAVEQTVLSAIKELQYSPHMPARQNILLSYGYQQCSFLQAVKERGRFAILAGAAAGGILFFVAAFLWHRKETARIESLTDYLEKVNNGKDGVLLQVGEDAFSKLQDEIYKTVTALHQTRDAALKAKENFAENLYNIAHQIKTPITAISLSMQLLQEESCPGHTEMQKWDCREVTQRDLPGGITEEGIQRVKEQHIARITGQLSRLIRLEETLLLLARIDAGILKLERKEVDVFTLLMMAAENLQELFRSEDIDVKIPEAGEKVILADMDWTMEAVMNLLKNCMEHTPSGGAVYCTYEQNPLYTLIQIRDTGPGFAKEDIPHLFERFYRGKDGRSGGIGIGLALSRAIIERQNGTLSARNLPEGGACFEIRFYCH